MTDYQVALELYARDVYDTREQAHTAVGEDPSGCRQMLKYLRELAAATST